MTISPIVQQLCKFMYDGLVDRLFQHKGQQQTIGVEELKKHWTMLNCCEEKEIASNAETWKQFVVAKFFYLVLVKSREFDGRNEIASTLLQSGGRHRGKRGSKKEEKKIQPEDLPLFQAYDEVFRELIVVLNIGQAIACDLAIELATQAYIERTFIHLRCDPGLLDLLFEDVLDDVPIKYHSEFKKRKTILAKLETRLPEMAVKYPWEMFISFLQQVFDGIGIRSGVNQVETETEAESGIVDEEIKPRRNSNPRTIIEDDETDVEEKEEEEETKNVTEKNEESREENVVVESDIEAEAEERIILNKNNNNNKEGEEEDLILATQATQTPKQNFPEDKWENATASQLVSSLSIKQCENIAYPGLLKKVRDRLNHHTPAGRVIGNLLEAKRKYNENIHDPLPDILQQTESKRNRTTDQNTIGYEMWQEMNDSPSIRQQQQQMENEDGNHNGRHLPYDEFYARKNLKPRRPKTPWTEDEVKLLEEGMRKFGCSWASIITWANTERAGFNNCRIPTDLKDKARVEKMRLMRRGMNPGIFSLVASVREQ